MKTIWKAWLSAGVLALGLTGPATGASQAASPAITERPVGEALAAYLIGTWYSDQLIDKGDLAMERTYLRDGRFSVTIDLHQQDVVAAGDTPMTSRMSGKWSVEGDTLIEVPDETSPPDTTRRLITVESPDSFSTRYDNAPESVTFRRKPKTGAAHLRAYLQPWPEPGTPGDWIEYTHDRIGTSYIDRSTVSRQVRFAGAWTRYDLNAAGLAESRHLAAARPAGPERVLIMERIYQRVLIDCTERLLKRQETRIWMDAKEASASRHEGDEPLSWERIRTYGDDNAELARRLCEAPPAR
ncbi:MAG: hypothetical protein KA945_10360 [Zoogloea sp.]|jgi:hypothetical protein|nr:hypothetical protein [Zoogloea sp.]